MQLRRDDRGVTLIELLVAILILAIIIVPLGTALVGVIRNTDDTSRRLSESHDMQIASAYFAQDVQSLGVRNYSSATFALLRSIDNASYPCGSGPQVVRFAWDDATSASATPTTVRVAYVVRVVGGERQLRRWTCRSSSTVESDLVVVHNLDGTPSPPVCAPTACSGSGANVPQRVTLTLTIKDPASTGAATTLTLTGQRRQT